MPITITAAELASAIRVGSTAEETAEVTRILAYATEAIEQHLGAAYATTPDTVLNESAVRLSGYLYDSPTVSGRDGFAFAMRNSGAGRMLLPYVVHSLGSTGDAVAAQEAGGPGIDQGARDAAQAAQTRADAAYTLADGKVDQAGAEAAARGVLPMPATPQEAAGGTSTTIRAWTAALIRAAINAVVPDWARSGNTDPIPAPKLANAPSGAVSGLSITDLGSFTTTAQAVSGDVQDTGIASPDHGLFLIVTIGGEEDVLWFHRGFIHDNSGTPIPGGSMNSTVYITSIRAMRMGKTAEGNFALTNAFSSNTSLILAGAVVNFAVIG